MGADGRPAGPRARFPDILPIGYWEAVMNTSVEKFYNATKGVPRVPGPPRVIWPVSPG